MSLIKRFCWGQRDGLTQPIAVISWGIFPGDVQKSHFQILHPISKFCIPSAPSQSCPEVPVHPPKWKGDICTQWAAGSLQPGSDTYLYQADELIAPQLDLKPGFIFSFLILCLGWGLWVGTWKKCALAQRLLEPGLISGWSFFTIKWKMILFNIKYNFIIFLGPVR